MVKCMKEPKPASLVDLSFLGLNLFVTLFSGCFCFPRSELYYRLLLRCTFHYDSIESLCNSVFESPDRLLYYVNQASVEEVIEFTACSFRESLGLLKKHGLDVRRGVYVAIDYTDVEYEGIDNLYVFRTVKRKGNRYQQIRVLRFATLAIVSKRFKCTLAALPVKNNDRSEDIVDRLLGMTLKLVKVRGVLMDRGFLSMSVLEVVEAHHLYYILPVKRVADVDMLYWLSHLTGCWRWIHVMRSRGQDRKTGLKIKTRYKPVPVYLREVHLAEYIGVVTNREVKNTNFESLLRVYNYRWNIENSYKDCKNYRIKTSSRNPAYRLLLFSISLLMVNLQELARKATKTRITGKEMLMIFALLIQHLEDILEEETVRLTKKLIVRLPT